MTRQEAFDEINRLQDGYIEELIGLINIPDYTAMKSINFTSPTGTGKTKMMGKLINRFPDYYFVITSLSKGQLHLQIRDSLLKDCPKGNFTVYGSADYKINSRLDAQDIIGRIPPYARCIWLRDEGHIRTNRFDELLMDVCYKVVNFSATNVHSDILCNFTQSMMLRTVRQSSGTPEDAIKRLLEVKEVHKDVPGYNPCGIFRCVGGNKNLYKLIITLCEKHGLNYIDITEDPYVMAELCEDDNEYDVIINKFKITEGIDIRRAHVLYMDNQPANSATTIQVIGRCRRNALLYRDDIDIMDPENHELLEKTRECFVYYNVKQMKIAADSDGELQYAFCDHISCQELKAGTSVSVISGQLANGLHVIELEGYTGSYTIDVDPDTGFNVVKPGTDFYDEIKVECRSDYVYLCLNPSFAENRLERKYLKIKKEYIKSFPLITRGCEPYYDLRNIKYNNSVFERLNVRERGLIGGLKCLYIFDWRLPQKELDDLYSRNNYIPYYKCINDRQSAVIGTDLMRQIKTEDVIIWTESKAVTSKVGVYCKLNTFISNRYQAELEQAKPQYVKGKNNFNLDTKCNSIIGYCVEYYSKYLVYGVSYLSPYFEEATWEFRGLDVSPDHIVVRACMMKYREMMTKSFGAKAAMLIKSISAQKLVQEKYSYFVSLVAELGTKTAEYVRTNLYPDTIPEDNIDPNLSIRHISGLADYITMDTILDVKVRNCIDEKNVRQVLTYHYLSTKRSDLDIKRVIVYDAVSGKAVTIYIDEKNLSSRK